MIHAGPDKGHRRVTGRTILRTDIGVDLIRRWCGCRTTGLVAALTLRDADCTVIHADIQPVRVTMTGLAAAQAGMVQRPGTIRRVTTGGATTGRYQGMIDRGRTEIDGIVTGSAILGADTGM